MKTKILLSILLFYVCFSIAAQNNTDVCAGEDVYLHATIPSASTLQWQQSPTGVTFSNIPNATNDTLPLLNIQTGGYYRAMISDAVCLHYFTEIKMVTVHQAPTQANAGPDITATNTTVQLNANTPVTGTGLWSVVSGTGGSFSSTTNPQANFTGTLNSVYELTWTISNPPCAATVDTVVVTMPTSVPIPSILCNGETLYVHPTDNGVSVWGCAGFASGATSPDDGKSNTLIVVQTCTPPTAAHVCYNLSAFGFSDWYLPSYNELQCLRDNAAAIGGFSATTYWSSTECPGILYLNAYYRTFPSGVSGAGSKTSSRNLRCVRK